MAEYNADPAKGGVKLDANKNRLELLSVVALEQIGLVATHGSRKYADENWRKGMSWKRLVGAALRHLFAFARGVDLDPESASPEHPNGLPHLAHAGWCVMALIEFQVLKNGEDDRWRMPSKQTEFSVEIPVPAHCYHCRVKLTEAHRTVDFRGNVYCSKPCVDAVDL